MAVGQLIRTKDLSKLGKEYGDRFLYNPRDLEYCSENKLALTIGDEPDTIVLIEGWDFEQVDGIPGEQLDFLRVVVPA